MMASFMHVFHQSKCISAIKRIIFYYGRASIFPLFFHVFVFLVTAMHA